MIYVFDPTREAEILAALEARRRLRVEEEAFRALTYLDTFEWALHQDGGCLAAVAERSGVALEWRSFDGVLRHRLRRRRAPAFASDLSPGPFAEALAARTGIRRLLPAVEVETRGRQIRILGDEEKTVVRLALEHSTAREGTWDGGRGGRSAPLAPRLRVGPVKGYEAELADLTGLLEGELGLERSEPDDVTAALEALGRRPRDYSARPGIPLDPGMPAGEATRAVLRGLLATLEANEEGTRRGLDPEFLHDFRVAVRRTRSVLGQLRGILGAAEVAGLRRELAWLGGATGPARDLDVYLLKLDAYRNALPAQVREHLEPLGVFLREHQQLEQERLARTLGTKRYRELIRGWSEFLATEEAAEAARRPIGEVASERIWRAWRRVVKRGRKIAPGSPARDLHRLRIECKKLRYLLELFHGLYDEREVDPLIRALKKLQDVLGDFNDYEVQQRKLAEFADQMVMEDLAPVPTLLAMGRLMARLARGQEDERGRFTARFGAFSSAKNKDRFRRLFRPEEDAGP